MVVEESAPGLRGCLAWLGRHEAGHAALADVDAELEQLAVDPWRAPAKEMWNSTFPSLCETGENEELRRPDRRNGEVAGNRFT